MEYWLVRCYNPYAIDDEPTHTVYAFGIDKATAKAIARHKNKDSAYIYFAEEEPMRWV